MDYALDAQINDTLSLADAGGDGRRGRSRSREDGRLSHAGCNAG